MSPLSILLVIFIFMMILSNGVGRTLRVLPIIIIVGAIVYFLGWFSINFFWLIILIWLINKMTAPKKKRTTYYRTYYNSKEAEEMFNNFFRQTSGGYNNYYNNTSYQQNYGGSGYNSWTVNRDKYYKELEVGKNCTKEELRKAYLKKVKENHPDKFSNASEAERKYHEDKIKKINEAYDNLMKDFS